MASAAISIDLILPAFGRIRTDLGLAPELGGDGRSGHGVLPRHGGGADPVRPAGRSIRPPMGVAGHLRAVRRRRARPLLLLPTCIGCCGPGSCGGSAPPGLRVIAVADDPRPIRRRRHGARDGIRHDGLRHACPVIAPALGAGLIKFMPWRGTFVVCAAFGVIHRRVVAATAGDAAGRAPPAIAAASGRGRHHGDRAQPRRVVVHAGQRCRSSGPSRRTWQRPSGSSTRCSIAARGSRSSSVAPPS